MARLIKALVFLVVIAFLGLVGYAYLGDLSPDQSEMREPVQLDVGQ
jgi:predicted negative regulator of RcsB-dependent stress response